MFFAACQPLGIGAKIHIFFFCMEICAVIGCHLHAKIQTTWLPTMLRYHYMEFFSKLFQEIVPLAGEE